MSKAFTKEDTPEPPLVRRRTLDLPPGTKNYITPGGLARLRAELEALAAQRPPDLERIAELSEHLDTAEVVDPAEGPRDVVRFGATVTLRDDDGVDTTYQIVGLAEADPKRGLLSWRSPIARALIGARVGDVVTIRAPRGDEEIEVVAIRYGSGLP